MRRHLLALSVPLIAAALTAPAVGAAAGSSSVLAGKHPTLSDADSPSLKSGGYSRPTGRRWN